MTKVRVLFVCMGNICRSPTAEGIFRNLVETEGLSHRIEIDSAGTGGWHEGEAPDRRAQAEARRRGIDIGGLRARQVRRNDFDDFHYIVAMDRQNRRELTAICPPAQRERIQLLLDFAPQLAEQEVPDPYYGGEDGFLYVFDLVEEASRELLKRIRATHGLD
ncbi:MAG: hypothetical protein RLZZ303_425 [Candidatus Hydrogenedentota bacterium]